jgi:ketosteroid isomerase-like protein
MICVGLIGHSQEKNGIVYDKHPAIDKTKMLWAAFEKGDKTAFGAFLADSMIAIYNGSENPVKRDEYLKNIDWWTTEFENLKVVDDTPAYPDAIDYTKGGLWVQDWLLITGTHKKSGINLELHLHDLYSFNKAGKITALFMYFNNDQFDAINSSETIQENGKIYINHPYIIKVRKLVNAYCAKNLSATVDFYSPDASFSNSTMKWGETMDLAMQKKQIAKEFAENDNIKMRQVGYPDCIYYAKGDSYVVYSWWIWSGTVKATGKKVEMPIMIADTFNKEGKIVSEESYYSSNHFE